MDIEFYQEYEELLKMWEFSEEARNNPHFLGITYRTNALIKEALKEEYIALIDRKLERWIDVTRIQCLEKHPSTLMYFQAKMLYRDGYHESAIIMVRAISEMLVRELIVANYPHIDNTKLIDVNFRKLLRFLYLPRELSLELVNNLGIINNSLFALCYTESESVYSLSIVDPLTVIIHNNLKRFVDLILAADCHSHTCISKAQYNSLNEIYDTGNTYAHALSSKNTIKEDSRNILFSIGNVLLEVYGQLNKLEGTHFTSPYLSFPDVHIGFNFMIEAFTSVESAMLGYHNMPLTIKAEEFRFLVGDWSLEYFCSNNRHIAVCSIFWDKERQQPTTAEIRFNLDQNAVVQIIEKCHVVLFDKYIHLLGYAIESEVDLKSDYALDLFELIVFSQDILVGDHECKSGNGKVLMTKCIAAR